MSAYNNLSNDAFDRNDFYLCDAIAQENQCLSLVVELLACSSVDQRSQLLKCSRGTVVMYDKHSVQSLHRVGHIQCTMLVTLIEIAVARALIRFDVSCGKNYKFNVWLLYVLEFITISIPAIVSVTVVNPYVEIIVLFGFVLLIFIMWRTKWWKLASERDYEFGCRPALFTLMRSSINIVTAVCILAVDFKSFPKEFRKSRRYGVGLMDVGIGLFIFSMGLVASTPFKLKDIRKLVFTVGSLLILGIARTIVVTAIDYNQDAHEYGIHLNAFFTLGLIKLFATPFSFLSKNRNHLLAMGLVILVLHESTLQYGVSKYVMDPDVKRNNFINANREGLCSLPGFIALYLLSQCLGKWLQGKDILSFEEIKSKLKALSLICCILWLLLILAIFSTGIARVTCNLGYVVWILAIAVNILIFYLFVYDMVLYTLITKKSETSKLDLSEITTSNKSLVKFNTKIPLMVEAINFNSLTFFLLANILTGCTNIYFATDEKTPSETVFILFIYMFITTTFVFILYRFKIRIA